MNTTATNQRGEALRRAKRRVTLHLTTEAAAHLAKLAGGSRKQGQYLSDLIMQMEALKTEQRTHEGAGLAEAHQALQVKYAELAVQQQREARDVRKLHKWQVQGPVLYRVLCPASGLAAVCPEYKTGALCAGHERSAVVNLEVVEATPDAAKRLVLSTLFPGLVASWEEGPRVLDLGLLREETVMRLVGAPMLPLFEDV